MAAVKASKPVIDEEAPLFEEPEGPLKFNIHNGLYYREDGTVVVPVTPVVDDVLPDVSAPVKPETVLLLSYFEKDLLLHGRGEKDAFFDPITLDATAAATAADTERAAAVKDLK